MAGKKKAKIVTQKVIQKVNFWKFLRDVLLASMSKGQLPAATLSLIFIIMILKMPSEDVSKLVFSLFEWLREGMLLGYALFVLTLAGWAFHAKYQRRLQSREIDRLADERNEWQKKALGGRVESSKE